MLRTSNACLSLALLFACNFVFAVAPEERGAEEQKTPASEPPKTIILSPEKHQELLDKAARLAQLEAKTPPVTPSRCQLKGKVEGNLVVLQAQFGFATESNGAIVALACSPAFAGIGAQLDGHEPNLSVENGGFSVKVEKAGDHQLTLDLTLSVTNRADGRGFEMDLPRAAITEIELELPNAKDVRRDGKPLTDPRLVLRDGRIKGGLGAVDKLDLSWKEIGATTNVEPSLTSQGKVQVQIDDRETIIRADLTLKAEGGPVNQWRLLVPVGAIVQVAKEDEARVQTPIGQADKPFVSLRTIRLKEPSAEPLGVTITVKKPPPRPGVLTPVGPFAVEGAQRQSGVLNVAGSLSNLRPAFLKRGSTEEMRPSDDQPRTGLANFRYPSVTVFEKPQAASGPTSLSWLDIEAESVHGLIEARVTHVLRLMRDDTRRFWRVKTTIDAQPIRPGADHIDVLLPPYCIFDEHVGPMSAVLVRLGETEVLPAAVGLALGAASPNALRMLEPQGLPRVLHLKFPEQLNPFRLSIEADYQQPVGATEVGGEATLALPRPLGTPDRGGQVTITSPDDIELLVPKEGITALRLEQRDAQQQLWRSERFPEQVRVQWQTHRPHVRASALVDLTFTPREIQARQRLHFHFPHAAPVQVGLLIPNAVAKSIHVVGGGELSPIDMANPALRFAPLRPPTDTDEPATLELEYSFPMPAKRSGEPFLVPLVAPDQVVQGDTKVRVWGDLGAAPTLPLDLAGWSEQPLEVVKENPRLPALVLLAHAINTPLTLRMDDARPGGAAAGENPPITVLIDRALIRVSVGDGGQSCRASFLLTQLATPDLDVEFPAPVVGLNPRVLLDGKEVEMTIVDEAGRRSDGGRIARLRLSPDLVRRPSVLEIQYHLTAGRANSGSMQTTLQPPLIHGDTGRVPTRWLIAFPSNLVTLGPEGGAGAEPTWAWQGWLPTPRVAVSNVDLERWFAAGAEPSRTEEADVFVPSLVVTRPGVESITVMHAPRQIWLLVCSLLLLACGLGIFLLVRPSANNRAFTMPRVGVLVTGLLVLIVALVLGRFFLPTLTSAIFYGCIPGLVVLAFAGTLHLLWQEHARRQIVFLPSFTRGRGGSSIVRAGSSGSGSRPQPAPSSHPQGEPSTVDLVPPNGSNPRPLADVLRTEESSRSKRSG